MLITGAQDDRVDALVRVVGEVSDIAAHALQYRFLFPVFGPVIAHRRRAIATGDALRTVLVALGADVFRRIAAADQQYILVLELQRVAEIVCMQDATAKTLEAGEAWRIRCREVAARVDDIIELFRRRCAGGIVLRSDGEFPGCGVEAHLTNRRIEADIRPYAGFLDASANIVPQHLARWIRGDRFAEMLLEGVVRELQAFLWSVGPQVAIHAAVHRLAVLVGARAPGVIPHAAPVLLLLEADDIGNVGSFFSRGLESAQLRHPGRARTDDCNAFFHGLPPMS